MPQYRTGCAVTTLDKLWLDSTPSILMTQHRTRFDIFTFQFAVVIALRKKLIDLQL